jgi:hypothetical protein
MQLKNWPIQAQTDEMEVIVDKLNARAGHLKEPPHMRHSFTLGRT